MSDFCNTFLVSSMNVTYKAYHDTALGVCDLISLTFRGFYNRPIHVICIKLT